MRRGAAVLALLAIAGAAFVLWSRSSAETGGDWAVPTDAPTPVFSGLSVAAARERAEAEDRLLLLDFTAEWCGPCKHMEATTWRDSRVVEWVGSHAVAVQVDVDRQPAVARALEIQALPTVVVERGGREVDRSQGRMSARELLRWIDHAADPASPDDFVAADLTAKVPYTHVPDRGSSNAFARLSKAQEALDAGRYDEALPELEWLWAHGAQQQPSFAMGRWTALPKSMQALAEKYPPALDCYGQLLDAAQREIDADHVGVSIWTDWLGLIELTGERPRIEDWYERHRDADASIDAGRYWRCSWIADTIYATLLEQKRYADAGRVYREPLAVLERRRDLLDMIQSMPTGSPAGIAMGVALAASGGPAKGLDALREMAASMSATLIAAGRDDEAVEVGTWLIAYADDGASRKALVARAVEWSRPLPQHARWYAEALERGADVESLEPALQAALHH